MAQAAGHHYQNTIEMAESRVLHERQKYQRNLAQPDRHRHVSTEEKQIFRELHEQGFTGYQIAMLTGWGKTAVYRHLWHGSRRPRWTDEDNQVLVDGHADLPRGQIGHILAEKLGRSPRAIYIAMCRYRKKVRADPKKRRALSAISFALRAVRRADIFREVTE